MSVPQQLSAFNNQIPPRYVIKTITRAYTVTGADYGLILNFKGTVASAFSLPSAALLGAGFNFWVWNFNANTVSPNTTDVTVTPLSPETIDGQTNMVLRYNEGTQFVSDGKNWVANSKKTMRFYAENATNGTTSANFPVASGLTSLALGGGGASASATNSMAFGVSSSASGASSFAFGYFANASGSNAYAFNNNSSAAQYYKYAYGAAQNGGTCQIGMLPLSAYSTGATPVQMTSDGGAPSTSNIIILANFAAFAFSLLVVARQQGAGGSASAAWKVEGLIRRESGAATTTLVASTTTVISNVPGWSIAVSADTTNGGLAITATGSAGITSSWLAMGSTSELTFA